MKRYMVGLTAALALVALTAGLAGAQNKKGNPVVVLETSKGNIEVELNEAKAPISTKNFLDYVDSHFYDGLIFHRVIDNFMIQGGGYDKTYREKSTRAPIPNEAKNGLKNDLGTIAMARTNQPHSASAQFFINLKNNDFLNAAQAQDGWGYAVFGKVVDGLDVVTKIAKLPTGPGGPFGSDVPRQQVIIESASVVAAKK